jgi:hypothetical protein
VHLSPCATNRVKGVESVEVRDAATAWPNVDQAADPAGLVRDEAERAHTGVVSAAEAGEWLRQLEQADRTGCFFSAGTLFAVAGRWA